MKGFVPALFAVTLLLSAILLFAVQPMFAKMVLPLLGGTPAVWNTCVVFFQVTLLAGYAYAHATTTALAAPRQAALHLALVLLPLLLLPIAVPVGWSPPPQQSPVPWLLALLAVALGLPFFVVSTTAPLVQAWFSRTGHARAHDPYFLYAASNTGSLGALLAYPALIEPNIRLADQSRLWTIGYLVLALLLAVCASIVWRSRARIAPNPSVPAEAAPPQAGGASPGGRARWILLAAVPSSLMLGLTTYLTSDIAPMPLLWVLPLTLYLVTFVIAFAGTADRSLRLMQRLMPILILPLTVTLAMKAVGPLWLLVLLHLLTFFVTSMVCHGELARSRPGAERLTEFFLWVAVGGVLGGVFSALIAPVAFTGVVEYPLALMLACLLRPPRTPGPSKLSDLLLALAVPVALGALVTGLVWLISTLRMTGPASALLIGGLPALLCFAVRHRPLAFGLGVGALALLTPLLLEDARHRTLHRERSFFGVWQVQVDPSMKFVMLQNGTTTHGIQSREAARRQEPLSYFHRTGPAGQVFALLSGSKTGVPVAVIGLGTGSLACHGVRGQPFTFYEIDPAAVRIAGNPRYFTFLESCPPTIQIVMGDARRSLAAARDRQYGLIVLDAFSSDAIPSHLLTREALRLYLGKLTESGVLAFHISNRYLDLAPTVGNLAHDAGLVARARLESKVSDKEAAEGKTASHWTVLARRAEDLGALAADPRWSPLLPRPDKQLWTDDFSNIFEVVKWR
jgi:hypothetical protein